MPLRFKLTEDGKSIAMDSNGLPIAIDDSSPENPREFSIDGIHLYNQIPRFKTDIQNANKKAEEATNALKAFEGIEDPQAAIAALETVKNLDEGALKKASEVEALKEKLNKENAAKLQAAQKQYETTISEKDAVIQGLDGDLRKAVISAAFAGSTWFNGKEPKSKLSSAIAESFLGNYFKVERLPDGTVAPVAYIGETRIEDPAKGMIGDTLAPMAFDDAMSKIIEQHPQKNDILWPSSGTGAKGSNNNHFVGTNTIKSGDKEAFGANLEDIASGKVKVVD